MSLHQFFSIMRARRRLAGLILLGTVLLALAWVFLRPATYVARAPVLVDVRTDPTGGTPLQGMVSPGYISTQIDIIKSDRVAQKVVELLPPDQQPMLRLREAAQKGAAPQQWLVHAIQRDLEVKPARESNIINISWSGRTPTEAARVANAFAQAYLDTNLNLKTAPAKRYADWFDQQVTAARERLEKAQDKLSAFQEKAGIISSNEQGDYETARLSELSQQLMVAQGRRRAGAGETSSEVLQSPLVNNMRADVAKLESKVQEASATMGPNHPKMVQMEAELRSMRSRLAAESARLGTAAAVSTQASASRIRELQDAIAAQKARVLATNKQRGELSVLQREVDTAQKAFETVSASAAQSRLQSQMTQSNVVFLGSAVEPLGPSGPTPLQALLAALGAGTLLAVAGALLAELSNRRVRSVEDLTMVTQLPVLGILPAPKARVTPLRLTNAPRRLALTPQRSLA
ncbi:chain length determinant protein EpsF [Ramlibacter sp.]|uniref:chain length determinant protein EpsF n=1 Tax=Ramlibacter sp. TaxID=1917967 RepID=UPI002CFC6214|nr:chain length determinant protein EpsF [Ramlibacter sp.]HWI82321.1 chain length determinant protein EpsF [Ramlibacter sp.]